MWNEWNRWWTARRVPGEKPPAGSPSPTSQSENDQEKLQPRTAPRSEMDRDGFRSAPPAESEHADDTVPETVQPATQTSELTCRADLGDEAAPNVRDDSALETVPPLELAPEPPGSTDLGAEAAPDFADAPQSPAREDPGPDEHHELWGNQRDSAPLAQLDPVAELRRRGLALPTGKSRARRGRRLARPEEVKTPSYNPQQRLMILDCWQRSGLPAKQFATLVGVSKHTLFAWKQRFTREGPAGLAEQPRGAREGSRLPDLTKRTILLLKQAHPDWGCERISQMLVRGPALPASAPAVARVLREAGYELHETPTRPHPDKVRFFERARPNQLWQTDLFTFVLKRQNRRVYLVAFLDDHSRFLVSFGLHASQSTALVLEVLRAGITAYGPPEEVLTDNGAQYVTWRGESAFHKELTQRGIRHIVAAPRHPQTLGKIERFWGTLWRECVESAVFLDLADARARIGHFIDWYNFQRTHSGIGGLVPADRFFGAAPDVLLSLKDRVAANALELAKNGLPKPPFYMTGQLGGKNFSLHAEGERVFLTREGGTRQEVDLTAPALTAGTTAMPEALCPDGSPESGPPGDAPAGANDALPPDGSLGTSRQDDAGQKGGKP